MQVFKFLPVCAVSVLLLASCGEEPETVASAPPLPTAPDAVPVEAPEPVDSDSVFAPLDAEHAKNMKASAAEIAEIDRRIEESAEKQNAEMLVEVEAKLAEFRAYYIKTYRDEVVSAVEEYEGKLNLQYLQSLRQSEAALRQAGEQTLLAGVLAEEIKSVEAGNKPPAPPAEDDKSNPGLKLLFDMRRSYYDNYANIDKAVVQSRGDLTAQYHQQLAEYHAWATQMTPPASVARVAEELKGLDGEWWIESKPPAP